MHTTTTPCSTWAAVHPPERFSVLNVMPTLLDLMGVRRKAGLLPCKLNPILAAVAQQHSVYMRDHDCFDHQCVGEPSASERACLAGYRPYGWGSCYVGETIAAGYWTPAEVIAAWLDSPGHRTILLDENLREIGVGFATGGRQGPYWTANYGSQPDVLPVFINLDQEETSDRLVELALSNELVSDWGGIGYADEVMISSRPDFAGACWEPYRPYRPYTLPEGNGLRSIYVRYRDTRGYQVLSIDDIQLQEPDLHALGLVPGSLIFLYEMESGRTVPAAAWVQVYNATCDTALDWRATASWVSCLPLSGTTPAGFSVSVGGLQVAAPRTLSDTVVVSLAQQPSHSQKIQVTVLVVEKLHRTLLPLVTK
jgi:hypothetical protein